MPLAYFITFRTYGTWLHGDRRGSVDRHHNARGAPVVNASEQRLGWCADRLRDGPVCLNPEQRRVVSEALREACEFRSWRLLAANVRTNHVHVVISADVAPERVMTTLKAWASRRLGTGVWARHGSTRYLWRFQDVVRSCHYVLHEQDRDPGGAG